MNLLYETGKIIYKDYRLIKYIGQGGYGRVYLVENKNGVLFALKVLLSDFHLEYQGFEVVKRVNSPRLVKVYEYGQTVNAENCVLMEYACEDMEKLLSRQESIQESKACYWFIEILKGLQILEKYGIIHRDLKPANMFVQDDIVKIGDFGTTKFTSGQSSMSQVALTYAYAAPERFGANYGHAVDRWSAAVTFYRMLTGHLPFSGEDIAEVLGAIFKSSPDLSLVPEKYRSFLSVCFQKNPQNRHLNAIEMIIAFEEVRPPLQAYTNNKLEEGNISHPQDISHLSDMEKQVLHKIGFQKIPQHFLYPERREKAEKLFQEGLSEQIPGFKMIKMKQAAELGHIKAIEWIQRKGVFVKKSWWSNAIDVY